MAGEPLIHGEMVQLYAQALVAIARADEEIGLEEGLRLQQRIEARAGQAMPLDDLLLAEPLDAGQLADGLRHAGGPFRDGGLHPGELARMIVVDGISVVLAKGYISEDEARVIVRFATALGCTLEEVRQMSEHLAPWLPHYRNGV